MFIIRLHLPLNYVSVSTPTYDARWTCFNFTHILMNIFENIDLHNSLETFSIRIVWHLKIFKAFWSSTPHKVKIRDTKLKNNAVQNKNTRSFEHTFPAILKTVHSDKRNSNRNSWLFQSTTTGQCTLLSLPVDYPWFNICITKKRTAFQKFC